MIAVAQSVAGLPAITDAFDDADPSATIQPVAEVIRRASDVTYVVVANDHGIRYSHPNPDRIGEKVSTDPAIPLSGEIYVGTQTGTLGESWRVKVPIFDDDGEVMGQVSVGILESELRADFLGGLTGLLAALVVAAVDRRRSAPHGSRRVIRRRIYGLEPDEIRAMLETREAMLHGIREGLVAVDDAGRIVLMNDAAARLLDIPDAGRRARRSGSSRCSTRELARFIASGEDQRDAGALRRARAARARATGCASTAARSGRSRSSATAPSSRRCCGSSRAPRASPRGCAPSPTSSPTSCTS